jgi:hypothetical protein
VRGLVYVCLLGALLGLARPALAVQEFETRKTISMLSVNGTIAAVSVDAATVSRSCAFGVLITFNPTTPLGKIFYATLLSANAANTPVTLTYERNGNSCTLTQIDSF